MLRKCPHFTPSRSAPSRSVPSRLAPVRSASRNSAPAKSASSSTHCRSTAPCIFASRKLADRKLASSRLAPGISALRASAPARFARERFTLFSWIPCRNAIDRSTPTSGTPSLFNSCKASIRPIPIFARRRVDYLPCLVIFLLQSVARLRKIKQHRDLHAEAAQVFQNLQKCPIVEQISTLFHLILHPPERLCPPSAYPSFPFRPTLWPLAYQVNPYLVSPRIPPYEPAPAITLQRRSTPETSPLALPYLRPVRSACRLVPVLHGAARCPSS